MSIKLLPGIPDAHAFKTLYDTTQWGPADRPADYYRSALEGSWYCVGAFNLGNLVGFGRLISDGKLHAFVTEMIVHPSFRDRGIGRMILRSLLRHCSGNGITDIQLFCARGMSGFYLKNGFAARSDEAPGMQYVSPQVGAPRLVERGSTTQD